MTDVCQKCGHRSTGRYDRIEYHKYLDMEVCGKCENDFEDGVEEHEERKRRRIAEENEY